MGKKLAIKGHSTRGKEIIELLEMMGGTNKNMLSAHIGDVLNPHVYFLEPDFSDNIIVWNYLLGLEWDGRASDMMIFTLEEFLEKYPYKVGDVIKFPNNMAEEIAEMKWDEELKDVIYTSVSGCTRPSRVPKNTNKTNMNMNENKVESTGFMQLGKTFAVIFNDANYEDEVELQLGDYEVEVRDGKTYAVRKKSVFPKTLGDCCKVINNIGDYQMCGYKHELLFDFQNLLICLGAYWKIAGEEMGLGKPWEPDWDNLTTSHHFIKISKGCFTYSSRLLVFPSAEMRDAFEENFKDLIEQCKELL